MARVMEAGPVRGSFYFKSNPLGTSLVVQWLRICTSTSGSLGSIPSWGTKIQYAAWCDQKIKTFLNNCILSHILMSNVNPDYGKTF